jgi:zinc and cadmium transporter
MHDPMLSHGWLLAIYCALVTLASLTGGWLLILMRPTHTRLQVAISFVSGLMLGIALIHFLPDALEQLKDPDRAVDWMLGGFMGMFFLQRFFHFHHHDTIRFPFVFRVFPVNTPVIFPCWRGCG